MRLVEKSTNRELKEGDEVNLRREPYLISGLVPKSNRVYLVDAEADRSPFAMPPAAIGAEFRH